MNIGELIGAAPGLLESLKETGLSGSQVEALSDEIGSQLEGDGGFDLKDLLTGLDANSFLERLDVQALAAKLGIDTATVESALQLIAPKVEGFTGDLGGLARNLGSSLAGSLFGKR